MPSFAELLASAVTDPGIVAEAYRAFHNYSIGNQLLALSQCAARGIQPGPIATFVGWKEKGRFVRKGERALTLCRPITIRKQGAGDTATEENKKPATAFVYKAAWFVYAQTDGQPLEVDDLPAWHAAKALAALEITEEPFTSLDGNVQGYARERAIAVSPLAFEPHSTRFHEIAHVVLGHTSEAEATPRSLGECEAEAVAMLCCAALGLPGVEHSRGYIQNWTGREPIPDRSAQRILKAADQILKAGLDADTEGPLTMQQTTHSVAFTARQAG
jgi:antirestriction protein ArdC